jgi:hypothetical protein
MPDFATFRSLSLSVGTTACAMTAAVHADWELNGLAATTLSDIISESRNKPSFYYDFCKVAEENANYHDALGETANATMWRTAGKQNFDVLNGGYYVPNDYASTGYWVFTRGPKLLYKRTGIAAYRDLIGSASGSLLYDAAFGAGNPYTVSPTLDPGNQAGRELTYHIQAHMDAQELGFPVNEFFAERREKLFEFLPYIYNEEWLELNKQVSPFMCGLIARTLIEDWNITRDSRTVGQVTDVFNYFYDNGHYRPATKSFVYNANPYCNTADSSAPALPDNYDVEGDAGAPDINMLFAPAMMWAACRAGRTNGQRLADRADELFDGTVDGGDWVPGKPFNQFHTWAHSDGYFGFREKFYGPAGAGTGLRRALRL